MSELCIGLMSGTSLDGVDGVLVEWLGGQARRFEVRAHCHLPFDAPLAAELLALNSSGADELHRAALAGNAVSRRYAEVVAQLLARSGRAAGEVSVIGAHGQTVRHRPGQFDGTGYTLQLLNPSLLAESTGIAVVADLRSRDVAAGGQGAPLVPAFHRAAFGQDGAALAVLNLGGIGNLTLLGADGSLLGFDCGPGNALLDLWVRQHRGKAFDTDGRWAASGRVQAGLLAALQSEPYFDLAPPKSTGRDLFHADWLQACLDQVPGVAAADVQATLAELSAWAAARDLRRHAPQTRELLVCGGGAFNRYLIDRLSAMLPGVAVDPTSVRGLPPDQVEACAFAWLARAFLRREAGNLPSVTGARGLRVLGGYFPA